MTTVTDLARRLAAVEAFIAAETAGSAASIEGRTSQFWAELFRERSNFPDVNAFLAFRRDDYGYGLADERQGGAERERRHIARTAEIFRWSVDPAAVGAVDEPSLGAPFVAEAHGVCCSSAFWVNAATAHRVRDFVRKIGPVDRPLRILEIGAGWGAAAYQIHKLLPVDSYTIVDLPENLLLSTVYLGSTLGLDPVLIGREGPIVDSLPERTLASLLPGSLPRLGMSYDLILNSFSLQEMDLDTARAYLSWIDGALSNDGIFVSINAHGKAGIRRPSDYGYERFHLHHIGMFRRFPSGFENTIPSVVVASRRGPSDVFDARAIETLCCLHQFGLDQDLERLAHAVLGQDLSPDHQHALASLHDFFTNDPSRREAALDQQARAFVPSCITAYLRGQHLLAQGSTDAARDATALSLEHGLTGFAAVRAEVTLAVLSGRRHLSPRPGSLDPAFAYPDIERVLDQGDLGPIVRRFQTIMAF